MDSITVADIAAEIDSADQGRGVNTVISFLGHRDGLTAGAVLDASDVADVRTYLA